MNRYRFKSVLIFKVNFEKERETLKIWTDSGKRTQEILGGGNWKTGLGYVEKKKTSQN